MFIDEPALQCREPRAAQSPEMQDDGCGNLNRTHEGTLGGTSTEHERLRTSTNLRRRRRQQYCTVHAAEGLRASRCMNPNGRKQQSTEHERLRRDGSSIQLMCTSTGRHEGCRKRMGVLIHMCANVLFLMATDASNSVHPNGRKQQSTEHERLRRDGSSIQLMCTSTGRHEGFWKRMGVLICFNQIQKVPFRSHAIAAASVIRFTEAVIHIGRNA